VIKGKGLSTAQWGDSALNEGAAGHSGATVLNLEAFLLRPGDFGAPGLQPALVRIAATVTANSQRQGPSIYP
jgi:hypothetical protein